MTFGKVEEDRAQRLAHISSEVQGTRGFGLGRLSLGKVQTNRDFSAPLCANMSTLGLSRGAQPLPQLTAEGGCAFRDGSSRPAPGCDWTRRLQAPFRNTSALGRGGGGTFLRVKGFSFFPSPPSPSHYMPGFSLQLASARSRVQELAQTPPPPLARVPAPASPPSSARSAPAMEPTWGS